MANYHCAVRMSVFTQRCHILRCEWCCVSAEEGRKALSLVLCYIWSCGSSADLTASRVLSTLPASGLYPHSKSYKFSQGNNSVSIEHSFLARASNILLETFPKFPVACLPPAPPSPQAGPGHPLEQRCHIPHLSSLSKLSHKAEGSADITRTIVFSVCDEHAVR